MSKQEAGSRLATRAAFLVAGFGLACWAPLVPLAKARLGVDDRTLGLLLLCLGLGSVIAMQLAGPLTSRIGARPAVIVGGIGQAALLPFLAFAPTIWTMAASLLLFGGFLGVIEVGMNVHAVEVEKRAGRPLMSGFHGLFSVGGFIGASMMTVVLSIGLDAVTGAVIASILMIAALILVASRFIATPKADSTPLLVIPRGIVILLSLLAALTFLTEGAILDWGALLLSGKGVNRRAKLTPYRRPILTPPFGSAAVIPVVDRRGPRTTTRTVRCAGGGVRGRSLLTHRVNRRGWGSGGRGFGLSSGF